MTEHDNEQKEATEFGDEGAGPDPEETGTTESTESEGGEQ